MCNKRFPFLRKWYRIFFLFKLLHFHVWYHQCSTSRTFVGRYIERMLFFSFYAIMYFHLAQLGQGKITSSNQLNNDFFNSFGRWTSVVNGTDTVEWKIASIVATDFFHSIPRGVLGQGDMFAYVQGTKTWDSQTALLVSETVPCQLSNGKISFYLWSTVLSPSGIELCVEISTQNGKTVCFQSRIGYQGAEWKQVYADVAPSSVPFKFIIKAQVQGPQSIIGIDKVEYIADVLCDVSSVKKVAEKRPNLKEILPDLATDSQLITDPDVNVSSIEDLDNNEILCTVAECDFESDICGYGVFAPEINSNEALKSECNALKGHSKIRPLDGRCFLALSTTKQTGNVSVVLSSPSFFTYESTDLYFSYLLSADKIGRLTVCVENLDNCVFDKSEPPRNWFIWWTQRIQLQPGRQQIFFVLEQQSEGTHVAIDNIKLFKTLKNDPASCSVYN